MDKNSHPQPRESEFELFARKYLEANGAKPRMKEEEFQRVRDVVLGTYGSYHDAAKMGLTGAMQEIFKKAIRFPLFDSAMVSICDQVNEDKGEEVILELDRDGSSSKKTWDGLAFKVDSTGKGLPCYDDINAKIKSGMQAADYWCVSHDIAFLEGAHSDLDYHFTTIDMTWKEKEDLVNKLRKKVVPFEERLGTTLGSRWFIDFRPRSSVTQFEGMTAEKNAKKYADEETAKLREKNTSKKNPFVDYRGYTFKKFNESIQDWSKDKRTYQFYSMDPMSDRASIVISQSPNLEPRFREMMKNRHKQGFLQGREHNYSNVLAPAVDFLCGAMQPFMYAQEIAEVKKERNDSVYGDPEKISLKPIGEKMLQRLRMRA
jgi:hypothetical protein